MINVTNFNFSIRSGFKCRLWLGVAVVLFSSAASAQTYPVSGMWVATDDRFPGSTGGACLILKQFGIDAVLAQPFPRLMIFSKDTRFEVREDYLAERTIKSATDGGIQITETFANRWRPFSKRQVFKLKVVDPTTIEIAEGKARTRFFKCSSSSSL